MTTLGWSRVGALCMLGFAAVPAHAFDTMSEDQMRTTRAGSVQYNQECLYCRCQDLAYCVTFDCREANGNPDYCVSIDWSANWFFFDCGPAALGTACRPHSDPPVPCADYREGPKQYGVCLGACPDPPVGVCGQRNCTNGLVGRLPGRVDRGEGRT